MIHLQKKKKKKKKKEYVDSTIFPCCAEKDVVVSNVTFANDLVIWGFRGELFLLFNQEGAQKYQSHTPTWI